jgi:hypothetical protein
MGIFDNLKNELDTVVNDATSYTDLADKVANTVGKFAGIVPGVGPQVATVVDALNALDKALHDLQSAIG